MALELLAGPFVVTNVLTGAPLPSPLTPFGTSSAIWLDGRGILLSSGFGTGTQLAQMDGAAYPVTDLDALAFGLQQNSAGVTGYAIGRPWYTPAGDWDLDPVTLAYGTRAGISPISFSNYLRLPDRYLRTGNALEHATRSTPTAPVSAWSIEASHAGLGQSVSFSWVGTHQIMVGFRNGWIRRYDTQARAWVGSTKRIGTTCRGLWYSARLGVFISLADDPSGLLVCTWADSPRPAAISDPLVAGGLVRGRRVTVAATVTGSYGEPCPDEVVRWNLDGPGTLLQAATATDAAGTARTTYDTPDAVGAEVILTATVDF